MNEYLVTIVKPVTTGIEDLRRIKVQQNNFCILKG
jgi:hypothetical protein